MLNRVHKDKVTNVIEYILAIILVYCNGSWLMFEAKSPLQLLLIVTVLVYLMIRKSWYQELQFPNIWVLLLAVFPFLSLITNIHRDINLFSVIYVSASYILLACFNNKTFVSILNRYAHFIYVLMLISIPIGIITLVDYSVLSVFPVSINDLFGSSNTNGYYNLILYTDRVVNDLRTQSIFWEPGAWAFNEVFAFYWFIFIKQDYKKLPYLLLSLLLTLSTTGLFLGILLLFAAFIKIPVKEIRRKIIYLAAGSAILLISGSVYISTTTDINIAELFYEQVVEKFTSDSKSDSFEQRVETTKQAYEIAVENPFFGIGKTTDETQLFITSGLAEIVYQLGFLYLGLYLVLFRVLFSKLGWIISCLFIGIMINGEAYSFYILSSLIVIYGAKNFINVNPFHKKFAGHPENQLATIK